MTPSECDARSSNGTPLFRKECPDCGKVSLADRRRLGTPCMSCANKRRATHGLTSHPLYKLLKSIEARCKYPSATNYAYYGGRGISVCKEWQERPEDFVAWALEQGWRPGLQVDRIDTDGDYTPENCQLLTPAQNSRKRRNARCSMQAARVVRDALKSGASITRAAALAGVPYMSAWHIARGNTWRE